MRAPQNEATGTSGESEVQAEFERLGWGVVMDSRHDTGTDLLLRPRDPRRFEMGVIMGAQVKTGPSHFGSPRKSDDGTVDGWWFAQANREHFDYWITHAVPHILVLRDQEAGRSYWAHVTSDSVVSTGQGAKILVPRTQTIDTAHQGSLTAVALTQLPDSNWEGSAWSGAVVVPDDRIRHALIAPRLIAPHPNAKPSAIDGIQGLAAQVLIRPELERMFDEKSEWQNVAKRDGWSGPNLQEAKESDAWSWHATVALRHWLFEGESDGIDSLQDSATDGKEFAAATILRTVVLMENGGYDDAHIILTDAVAREELLNPGDLAWLNSYLAWVLYELGHWDAAIEKGFLVLEARRAFPTDVTLSALAGSSTLVIFRAYGWRSFIANETGGGEGSGEKGEQRIGVGEMIGSMDNPAAWWRSQLVAWALPAELDDLLRRWSEDRSIVIGGHDRPHRLLRSAALLSAFAGDGDGYRSAMTMLGKHLIVRSDSSTDPNSVQDSLAALLRGGDMKAVKLAVGRVVREGPATAVREGALVIQPYRSTHTSASADIAFLVGAGDVLDPRQADELCAWAGNTIRNPREYADRVRPYFLIGTKLLELIGGVVSAASDEAQSLVIDLVLEFHPDSGGLEDQDVARVIRRIRERVWTDDQLDRGLALTQSEGGQTARAIEYLAARRRPTIREAVVDRIAAGDWDALGSVDSVADLPAGAVEVLIRERSLGVDRVVNNARRSSYSVSTKDVLRDLVLINIWHPEGANWTPVIDAFSEPMVQAGHQVPSLELLAQIGNMIPSEIQRKLVEVLVNLRTKQPRGELFEQSDVRGPALEALWSLGERSALIEGLSGEAGERRAVARIIGREKLTSELSVLALLTRDQELSVRSAAAKTLSEWLVAEVGGDGVVDLCQRLLADTGTFLPVAMAPALAQGTRMSDGVVFLRSQLENHLSARIRNFLEEQTT